MKQRKEIKDNLKAQEMMKILEEEIVIIMINIIGIIVQNEGEIEEINILIEGNMKKEL